ncbi:MAG: ABC transporter permease subunit [Desulfotomaculaceae bacterium]
MTHIYCFGKRGVIFGNCDQQFATTFKGRASLTVIITVLSVTFGCVIGLIVGLARLSKNRLLRFLATAYVDFFRGTPLLVQILIVYFGTPILLQDAQGFLVDNYGMPQIINNYAMPRIVAAIIACSLNSGACTKKPKPP